MNEWMNEGKARTRRRNYVRAYRCKRLSFLLFNIYLICNGFWSSPPNFSKLVRVSNCLFVTFIDLYQTHTIFASFFSVEPTFRKCNKRDCWWMNLRWIMMVENVTFHKFALDKKEEKHHRKYIENNNDNDENYFKFICEIR